MAVTNSHPKTNRLLIPKICLNNRSHHSKSHESLSKHTLIWCPLLDSRQHFRIWHHPKNRLTGSIRSKLAKETPSIKSPVHTWTHEFTNVYSNAWDIYSSKTINFDDASRAGLLVPFPSSTGPKWMCFQMSKCPAATRRPTSSVRASTSR